MSTPAATTFWAMSADCWVARRLTRPLTALASMVVSTAPTPIGVLSWISVSTFEAAMKVFEGTQSERTQAPPAPVSSMSVTSAPSCAATRAASYPAGPPPMIATRATVAPFDVGDAAVRAGSRVSSRRASLCRLWLESRPRPHAGDVPAFPAGRDGLARRLASDVRRRGPGMGLGGGDGRRGAGRARVRRAVRPGAGRSRRAGRAGGLRLGSVPQDALAGGDAGGEPPGVAVRVRGLRGRAAEPVVPGRDRARGRGRGRAAGLRGVAAQASDRGLTTGTAGEARPR